MELFELNAKFDANNTEFDVADDIVFFMNTDADIFRRNLYPAKVKYKVELKKNREGADRVLCDAIQKSYKTYLEKFNLKTLPSTIDKDVLTNACSKLKEQIANSSNRRVKE